MCYQCDMVFPVLWNVLWRCDIVFPMLCECVMINVIWCFQCCGMCCQCGVVIDRPGVIVICNSNSNDYSCSSNSNRWNRMQCNSNTVEPHY